MTAAKGAGAEEEGIGRRDVGGLQSAAGDSHHPPGREERDRRKEKLKGIAPQGLDEMVRTVASLELLPPEDKELFGGWVLARLQDRRPRAAHAPGHSAASEPASPFMAPPTASSPPIGPRRGRRRSSRSASPGPMVRRSPSPFCAAAPAIAPAMSASRCGPRSCSRSMPRSHRPRGSSSSRKSSPSPRPTKRARWATPCRSASRSSARNLFRC